MYDNSRVGFNAYTREYIILDPLLYDLLISGTQNNNFEELKEIHSEFYDFLIEQGFIIEDTIDEFNLVKELSKAIDSDASNFELIVNPTMNCNFKCWYCYETHIKDSKMSEATIQSIINLTNNVILNQVGLRNFSLSFFGGEPLLYFHKVIEPLLIKVNQLCEKNGINFNSGMTTNGLLINNSILEICQKNNLNGFQITLDGNREQHNKVRFISEDKGSYDKIVSNIIQILKMRMFVTLRINCSPETMVNLHEIINEFEILDEEERHYLKVNIHKVWQVSENIERMLDDSRDFFKKNGFQVSLNNYDTVINSCYGDKRYQATINYNGEIFKCTARDFTNDSGEGQLNKDGTITWNEKFERRLDSKFHNPPCKECSILPICGGGCTQQALEHIGKEYCIYNFDEGLKLNQVIKNFESIFST